MNHDMIAAGHPRLHFDFAESLRRLPRHWPEKTPGTDREVRNWLVGRVVHAEAACRLLADRAERAGKGDPATPWPEFAEFNCASCHHEVPEAGRNGVQTLGTRPVGSPRWQAVWPVTHGALTGTEKLAPLIRVVQSRRPTPPGAVLEPARTAAGELAKLRERFDRMSDAEVRALVRGMFPRRAADTLDADALGQILLGRAALERATRNKREPHAAFSPAFEAMRERKWGEARARLDELLGAP